MEEKWIKKIKHKPDNDSANELVSMYYKEIYAYVYKQTLNRELALDLTQEIFIKILQTIDSFDEKKASFRTWLYRIATFRIVDYYRSKSYKQQSKTDGLNEVEVASSEDFTIRFEYKEDIERVIQTVNTMDSSNQQIFRLKLFGEYTFLEISILLNINEFTVKSKYYSMIKKIKSNLGAKNHE